MAIYSGINVLTRWGRVTNIYVSKLTIIDSDNGLSPDRRHAFIWTNVEILLIRTLRTNLSEILSEIPPFSIKNSIWNVYETVAILSRPQCVHSATVVSQPRHNGKQEWGVWHLHQQLREIVTRILPANIKCTPHYVSIQGERPL